MNTICLVGRAGRDPEVRYFETGKMVANLTLAVRRGRDEKPDWFNLEIWGRQAQVAADYVRKGSLIGVSGPMNTQTWEDRNTGEERQKWVVSVQRLDLLGSKSDNQSSDSTASFPAAGQAHSAYQAAGWNPPAPVSDEEVPF